MSEILAERERCAKLAEEMLKCMCHDEEDLDREDGDGVSDHLIDADRMGWIFDARCGKCRATQLVAKIRSGE